MVRNEKPLKETPPLSSGQHICYDTLGREMVCEGSGQDGEMRFGLDWPEVRFVPDHDLVEDRLTGLVWTRDSNLAEFPISWQEALDFVAQMNRDNFLGFADWRLPNRKELLSLLSYSEKKPALPAGHPFQNIFLHWYWTSTTAAIHPAYAWYIHLEGARMFYGRKSQYALLWPVRGHSGGILPKTGQQQCYDSAGNTVSCQQTGQDGELQLGAPWPQPRFIENKEVIVDSMTGIRWMKNADITAGPVVWREAFSILREINKRKTGGIDNWCLPSVTVLESLVDCSQHSPALPQGHPFEGVHDVYWSSTSSFFETDWAWALYLHKGALGVGFKKTSEFHVWPVAYPRE